MYYHIYKTNYILTYTYIDTNIYSNILTYTHRYTHKMPAGTLIDIAAHGPNDSLLIGNPQTTVFRAIYKRHTPFTRDNLRGTIDGDVDFGQKIIIRADTEADLMGAVMLEIDLPELQATGSDDQHYIQWIPNIGFALIEYAELKIGGQRISKEYGEWMYIWYELTESAGIKQARRTMTGATTANGTRTVYVPLTFWFCRDIGRALPLVSLQYHPVTIEIQLAALSKLYYFGPTRYYDLSYVGTVTIGGSTKYKYQATSGTLFSPDITGKTLYYNSGASTTSITYLDTDNLALDDQIPTAAQAERVYIKPTYTLSGSPSITDIRAFIDYYTLDTYERRWFAHTPQYYMIEQLQFNENESIVSGVTQRRVLLTMPLPMKQLFWVFQTDENLNNNERFSFLSTPDEEYENPNDDIASIYLYYNGKERIAERSSEHYRLVHPWQRKMPGVNETSAAYIYTYSFAEYPTENQPSGFSNFSLLDRVEMFLNMRSGHQAGSYRIYGLNYNFLRIEKGMGGVLFAN